MDPAAPLRAPPALYPLPIRVVLVVTEHASALSHERKRHYERIRRRLEDVSGGDVESTHYLDVRDLRGAAAVLRGSFASCSSHDRDALGRLGDRAGKSDGPVLGICAGMQLQAMFAGGAVGRARRPPATGYGPVDVLDDTDLLRRLPARVTVYKHHTDEIIERPEGFRVLASSSECAIEAIACPDRLWWGTQFHPEEFRPEHRAGERVLRNFFELARATS